MYTQFLPFNKQKSDIFGGNSFGGEKKKANNCIKKSNMELEMSLISFILGYVGLHTISGHG